MSQSLDSVSPTKSSVELRQWLFYAAGSLGYTLIATALLIMHPYRYDPGYPNPYEWPVLAPSALVGFAALIGRSFNSFAGIYIGYLSDQANLQWGRRRPFLAVAIVPLLLSFILVFTPPISTLSIWNAIYLAITLTLFFLFLATYVTPYSALLIELVSTSEERLKLSTFAAIFMLVGNAIGLVATPWLVSQMGFLKMTFLLGIIGFISLVMPLALREPIIHQEKPTNQPFVQSVHIAISNSHFRKYLLALIPIWITMSAIFFTGNYFVVALLKRNIEFGSVINSTLLAGIVLGLPLISRLASSMGKKSAFYIALMGLGLGLTGISLWSIWLNNLVWLCLLLMILCGMGMSSFFILPNPMLADIVDEDTLRIGQQRGAVFFGISSMIMVITSGISALLTGLLLMLGKTAEHPLGVQLIYPVGAVLIFLSAHLIKQYPLRK